MDSQYQRRSASREPAKADSNRFLAYSRLRPRPSSNPRNAEEPRATAIDARLATVYDKIKGNPHIVLATYSEDLYPNLVKTNAWKDTIGDIERDSHRISAKNGGFAQVVELLGKFQAEVFDILKVAKKTDEINLKAKLWEVFNSLSNSLWSGFFKNKPDEKDLANENCVLKNSLDRMEEQLIRLKGQLQEREMAGGPEELYSARSELKRVKEHNRELQQDLNNKLSVIQNQEQQLSLLRHELRSKGFEADRKGFKGSSDEFREKLAKITQERDSLREWKNRFTQYPSTYEKAIQRIKDEHMHEKFRLQESIEHLQSLIGNKSPRAATAQGFFQQSPEKKTGKEQKRIFENETRLNETIAILKRENNELKDQAEMILNDYEEICKKFKIQSEQFETVKTEHAEEIENLMRQLLRKSEKNFEEEEGFEKKTRVAGIGKGKKDRLRAGKNPSQKDEKEAMMNEIEKLENELKVLGEEKKNYEEIVKNDGGRIESLLKKVEDFKKDIEEKERVISSLQNTVNANEEIVENDGERIESLLRNVEDFKKDIKEKEKDIKEKEKAISNLQNTVKMHEELLQKHRQSVDKLKRELMEKDEEIKGKNEEIREKDEEIKDKIEFIQIVNSENEGNAKQVNLAKKQNANDKKEIERLKSEVDELNSFLKGKESECESLEQSFKQIRLELIEQSNNLIEAKEIEIKKLKNTCKSQKKQIDSLNSLVEQGKPSENIEENTEDIKKLEIIIQELENTLTDKQIEIESLTSKIKKVNEATLEEKNGLKKLLKSNEEQSNAEIKKLHEQLEMTSENSTKLLNEKDEKILNLTEQIENFESELKNYSDALNENIKLNTIVNEKASEVSELTKELQEKAKRISDLKEKSVKSKQENEILVKQIQEFTHNLDSLESNFANKSADCLGNEQELKVKSEMILGLEKLLSERNETIEAMWKTNDSLKKQLENLYLQLKTFEKSAESTAAALHASQISVEQLEEDNMNKAIKIRELEDLCNEFKIKEKESQSFKIAYQKETAALQNEIDSLVQEKLYLQRQLKSLKDSTVENSIYLEKLEIIKKLEGNEKKYLIFRLENYEKDIEDLKNRNEEIQEELENKEEEIEILQAKMEKLGNENKKIREEQIEILKEKEILGNQVVEKDSDLESNSLSSGDFEKPNTVSDEIFERDEKIKQLVRDIQNLQWKNHDLEKQFAEIEKKYLVVSEEKKAEIEVLQEEFRTVQENFAKMESENRLILADCDSFKAKLKKSIFDFENLENTLTGKIRENTEEIQKLTQENNSKEEE